MLLIIVESVPVTSHH